MDSLSLYKNLKAHVERYGYGSITQEERRFLLRFRLDQSRGPVSRRSRPVKGEVVVTSGEKSWVPPASPPSYSTVDSCSDAYLDDLTLD